MSSVSPGFARPSGWIVRRGFLRQLRLDDVRPYLLTRRVQMACDVVILTGAFIVAYLLRFEFTPPRAVLLGALIQLPLVVPIQFAALNAAGVHSFIWRYVGMRELKAFVSAAAWSSLVLITLRFSLPDRFAVGRVPLSIIVIGTGLGFGGVLALRLLRRSLYERAEKRKRRPRPNLGERQRTLLLGAGQAGVIAARELEGAIDSELDIKGFVDDDPAKQGMVIQGLRVSGDDSRPSAPRPGAGDLPGGHHHRTDHPS